MNNRKSRKSNNKIKNIIMLGLVFFGISGIMLGLDLMFNYSEKFGFNTNMKVYKEPANPIFYDQNLYACVVEAYNKQYGTEYSEYHTIETKELSTIEKIDCKNKQVYSTKGLEYITALKKLSLTNNQLQEIDLGSNINLTNVVLSGNPIKTIDLSRNTKLLYFSLDKGDLTNIDVSNNVELTNLYLDDNKLTSIDVTKNTKLSSLSLRNNAITNIDLSNNKLLSWLDLANNKLTSIDLSQNVSLSDVFLGSNKLETLDINSAVTLDVNLNNLTSLNVSDCSNLFSLTAADNYLEEIDLSGLTSLTTLSLAGNNLKNINVSELTNLYGLDLSENELTSLDLSKNTNISLITLDNAFATEEGVIYANGDYKIGIPSITLPEKFTISYSNDSTASKYYELTDSGFGRERQLSDINSVVGKYGTTQKFIIKYPDASELSEFKLAGKFNVIKATSEKYVVDEDNSYIYTGTDTDVDTIKNNIKINLGSVEIKDDKLSVIYDNKTIKEFGLANVSFKQLLLLDNKLYALNTMNMRYDELKSLIDAKNVEYKLFYGNNEITSGNISNSTVLKLYKDTKQLGEYTIILSFLEFGDLNVNGSKINLTEKISYNNFIKNLTGFNITYKLFNGNTEVTSGDIVDGMKLKTYLGNELLNEYNISVKYLNISNDLNVDNINKIISESSVNKTFSAIKSKISTSGTITVVDKDGKTLLDTNNIRTGAKIKIALSDSTVEYVMTVLGDVDGDGRIHALDYVGVKNHIMGKDILTDVYLSAADADKDGKIHALDYVEIKTQIMKGGN